MASEPSLFWKVAMDKVKSPLASTYKGYVFGAPPLNELLGEFNPSILIVPVEEPKCNACCGIVSLIPTFCAWEHKNAKNKNIEYFFLYD